MTKIRKVFPVFNACLAVLLMCGMGSGVQAQTKTLGECIELGVQRNLQLKSSQIDITKGETQISQSRAMLLPQVNASLQAIDYLKNPVQVSGGTLLNMDYPDPINWQKVHSMQYSSQAMLTAQMPLYNQSILAAIDAAKTIRELNTLAYDKALETLTVQIAKVYFTAQACKQQTVLLDEDIERMTYLRDITEALYKQGVILEIDFTRININIINLQTQRAQYQMVFEQQLNTLRFLIDLSADTPLDVVPMEADLRHVPSKGISGQLPEQQILDTQHTLTEKQIKLVRAGYMPSVGLFGQTGYLGYQEKFGDFFKEFKNRQFGMAAIGLQVNIPIFDAKDKVFRTRQFRFDMDKIKTNRQLLDASLQKDYLNASLQLTQNEEIFNTQTKNRQQARNVYDITTVRYKEGVSSMTDLLLDDMRLISSEQDMVNAHMQYNLALVDYLRLEGNLDALK